MPKGKIAPHSTTGIGSLPHHNIDAALEFAFSFDIPFLPQIPMRNVWEYAVPQALDPLPGVRVERDGTALLDLGVWVGRAKAFDEQLSTAFGDAANPAAFAAFEPSSATSSSWQPFLWELQERKTPVAKVQSVGPLTAQWTLRGVDGGRLDQNGDVSQQVYRVVLARSLAMVRRLKQLGVVPLIFLDEPALFVFSAENPRHLLGLQELKLMVQTLRKEGALVGLHCCSNVRWDLVLGLGPDYLSFDTLLSLGSVLTAKDALSGFLEKGGRLALGVIPTTEASRLAELKGPVIGAAVKSALGQALGAERAETVLQEALWTPACGLALHTPQDAQQVLSLLKESL